ncbi:MAG TPA: hypothetical protein VID48_04515, partial [Solirubrobacteraceae bacterium]
MNLRRAQVLLSLLSASAIASVCPAGAASAHVSGTDAAATHAYLESRLALRHAEAVHASAELDAVDALAESVKAQCPAVLKDEPESASGGEISIELADAIFGAAERVGHTVAERYYKTVRRLRWSNPRLTKLLHDLALEQAEQSGVPAPPLCADLKFWVGSAYTATSATTKHYLQRRNDISAITTIAPEPHEKPFEDFLQPGRLIAHRLSRYEDHTDRLLAKKVFPSKEASSTSPAEAPFVEAVGR